MTESLTLAQQHLYTFQTCRRRFYLRYLVRLPWPEAPLGLAQEEAYDRGRRFHRWIERRMLGLPVMDESEHDPVLTGWWGVFQRHAPPLPDGRRFVETSLTVPIGPEGRHRLTGRFDLLIVTDEPDPAARLFDWKTGEPRELPRLRRAWQTRVYLFVLAEGGRALAPDAPAAFAPERLSITYWYVEDPTWPRVVAYDAAAHRGNRAELEAIVAEIDAELTRNEWAKTDDWNECRHCAYRAHCGRQAAGKGALDDTADELDEDELDDLWLEPQWG